MLPLNVQLSCIIIIINVNVNVVFHMLQRLQLCMSHGSTIRLIDRLGDSHDAKVFERLKSKMNSGTDKLYSKLFLS